MKKIFQNINWQRKVAKLVVKEMKVNAPGNIYKKVVQNGGTNIYKLAWLKEQSRDLDNINTSLSLLWII